MITKPREDQFFIYSARATDIPQRLLIEFDGDSYFEVTHLKASDDARNPSNPASGYRIQIVEQGQNGDRWFNNRIVSDLIFSQGANPRALRNPVVLPPNAVLLIEIEGTDLSTAYNRFDIALWGIKRYHMTAEEFARRRQRPYYVYATRPDIDIQGTTGFSEVIQIRPDSDFVVQTICGVGAFNRISGGSSGNFSDFAGVRIQITDLSINETYFQNPMPWFTVVGQPDFWWGPNRLLSPMTFRRLSQIKVDVTIDTADVADIGLWKDIQVGFEGYKIKD